MKTKGIYFLYRLLQAVALPALLFYFVLRGLRNPAYFGTLRQRFGFLPRTFRQTGPGAIWLHAVSVGEVLASLELVRRLRVEFPRAPIFISASTIAGLAAAREKYSGLASVFCAPVDYVFAVRRVLRALQPSLVLTIETEIWPNLIRETRRTGAALAIVSGRISDRAAPRNFRLAPFFRAVLPRVNLILAQDEAMRERFLRLGASPDAVVAAGNLKYDFEPREAPPGSPLRAFLERLAPARTWIAASTMPPAAPGDVDEDDAVLEAFRALAPRHPGLLLILVPRKPERFDTAARKLAEAGIPYLRRSALRDGDNPLRLPGVLLLDTIGELGGIFPLGDAVFMGGSLAARGGHNILEPAFFARPIITGPHMENFRAIAADFRAAGACVEIASPQELAPAVERAFAEGEELGRRALACSEARRGATTHAVAAARQLYDAHLPRRRPAQPWLPLLRTLAVVWDWGGRLKRGRDIERRRRLPVPVVSIGNVTMGGTGKTPCALLIASLLRGAGRRPGILTRGYGRHSPEKHTVVAPGSRVNPEHTGDEPQIFIRAAIAPVGIGPDRYRAGEMLMRRFATDVLLLDDGFQHLRLHRDADIVLIDALNPFAGGELFPVGRLREPIASLSRADVILITRSKFSPTVAAIERAVRAVNPSAPIFHAHVAPAAWVDHVSGAEYPLDKPPFAAAGAFCGLGNPASFWNTLRALGVSPVAEVEFSDHHRYRPHELRRMAAQFAAHGASAMLTTQKDSINLCDDCEGLAAPLRIHWLKVEMAVEHPDVFLREIERRLL